MPARLQLAMYAGPMGQTLDGLEGMLRQPHGCFEQTSSSTYPNVLILDYLRQGRVELARLITHRARCGDAAALYEALSRHKGQALCGVFEWE